MTKFRCWQGFFLASGILENGEYKISLYNSPRRFDCACRLLRELGCEIRDVERFKNIPHAYHVCFKPKTNFSRE